MRFVVVLFILFSMLVACGGASETTEPAKVETVSEKGKSDTKAKTNAKDAHNHDGVECACSKGKMGEAVWCDHCNMGYVNKAKTTDKAAVDKARADAGSHAGHNHDGVECACSKGKTGEAVWCDHCNMGYVNKAKTTDKAAVDKAIAESKSAEK